MDKPQDDRIKDIITGLNNCYQQLNMLASYINDYIEFNKNASEFKLYINNKYTKLKGDNDGQSRSDGSDSTGDRKDKSGDINPKPKSKQAGK